MSNESPVNDSDNPLLKDPSSTTFSTADELISQPFYSVLSFISALKQCNLHHGNMTVKMVTNYGLVIGQLALINHDVLYLSLRNVQVIPFHQPHEKIVLECMSLTSDQIVNISLYKPTGTVSSS
ncbi:hypothetical protein [Longirhabdus pacifica]|uniref:hypothetical protein n=1 Tax=Longirhabdus pacifica TaxID=2305227 RepID=UPI00100934F7|nr:hypothetical protein [Longirhabdus pacifica]